MLRGEAGQDMKALNNDTPYSIMFGPDKCFRDTNKVGIFTLFYSSCFIRGGFAFREPCIAEKL